MGQRHGGAPDCDFCTDAEGNPTLIAETDSGIIARMTFGPVPGRDIDWHEPGPDVPEVVRGALRLGPDGSRVPGRVEMCMDCFERLVSFKAEVKQNLHAHRHPEIKRAEVRAKVEAAMEAEE